MSEYTEIFGEKKRGRINEGGVEEGLRDYRRRQSAKKCASTYSLLGRTYITLANKRCDSVYLFFSDSLTYACAVCAFVRICYAPFVQNICEAVYVIYFQNF